MTARRLGRTALLVLATAFLAALALPLTARPASACLVSYDYRPDIKIDLTRPGFTRPCSDGTSYTGIALVVALAAAALGAAGARTVRRGVALTGPSAPGQPDARGAILAGYLQAAAFRLPPPNPAAPPYGAPGPAGPPPAAPPYPPQGAPYPPQGAPYPGSAAPYPGPVAPYPGAASPYPGYAAPYPAPNTPYPGANPPYPGAAPPYPHPPYQGPAAPPSGPPQGGHAVPPSDRDQAGDQ